MNNLAESYGDKLSILAFPCNQFGHQTNENNEEILNTLKYVRPGSGFEPADTITMFSKVDVNGFNAHPMFRWLRRSRQIPDDSDVCTKNNGVDDDEVGAGVRLLEGVVQELLGVSSVVVQLLSRLEDLGLGGDRQLLVLDHGQQAVGVLAQLCVWQQYLAQHTTARLPCQAQGTDHPIFGYNQR